MLNRRLILGGIEIEFEIQKSTNEGLITSKEDLISLVVDFEAFVYRPFTVQEDNDEDVLVTKWQLEAINENLETLLLSTKASFSNDYYGEAIKAFLETLTKEHIANLDKTNKAVDDSASVCKETTEKVDKLIFDVRSFMSTL
ncbi:unnamed protein product [Lactuca saligna]|uniref:Uncharacterized protein n=1 Tax=Lactuca saligna TaxID=75948 RepID=A0AA35VBL1_LACSI|nr:unnamed protein product [Lactuca saligna]